ncbi:Holliday junction resolvase RuvX [Arenibaculum pallidiluteum]|uniref:Holliday junction resolvase RuvX n=1 Tax=Arenibaculum pallidiluteum TaxID=2812559 RepID=UPI002E2A3A22|nr:Holliday junction resolvase RuvX [Arenibaculum pallidiluteum]
MPIVKPAELPAALPRGTRLMALDLGTRTIGMAVSDPGLTRSAPVGTIRRTKLVADLASLARHVREWDAGGFLLGLPLNMDGSWGPAADRARSFADELVKSTGVTTAEPLVALWDERLSSFEAEDRMASAGLSARRRQEHVDAAAAAVILDDFLASLPRG